MTRESESIIRKSILTYVSKCAYRIDRLGLCKLTFSSSFLKCSLINVGYYQVEESKFEYLEPSFNVLALKLVDWRSIRVDRKTYRSWLSIWIFILKPPSVLFNLYLTHEQNPRESWATISTVLYFKNYYKAKDIKCFPSPVSLRVDVGVAMNTDLTS